MEFNGHRCEHARREKQLVEAGKTAAAGEEILIAKNGKPLVRLTRLQSPDSASLLGAFAGKIHMADDFDELPEEFEPFL